MTTAKYLDDGTWEREEVISWVYLECEDRGITLRRLWSCQDRRERREMLAFLTQNGSVFVVMLFYGRVDRFGDAGNLYGRRGSRVLAWDVFLPACETPDVAVTFDRLNDYVNRPRPSDKAGEPVAVEPVVGMPKKGGGSRQAAETPARAAQGGSQG